MRPPSENTPFQAIWDGMNMSVDLSSLLTEAQHHAIAHALTATIGNIPDAFFGIKRNPCPAGESLYTFYWVSGGAFGKAEVVNPDEGQSTAPTISSWIRPLADVEKVDVGYVVTNRQVVGECTVKLKITAHWDDEAVSLDATGTMGNLARPQLEKLIELVLASVQRR